MTTAGAVMHDDVAHIGVRDTLDTAAQQMRQHGVGALPICDGEGHAVGIVTDRDIVVKCIAQGHHPATATAGEYAQGDELHTVESDADIGAALAVMEQYQVRRLPVTEHGRLVGIITEADLARNLPEQSVGEFVEAICEQKLPAQAETSPG
ncbi:CBS domain-containing protein [Nocardia speluncae]|uniref:CBS domain-containing protein n=1 Tax=Nocardia speluncae TaxID=419477 RepID=A0A846X9P5_9NOCA|nr:CBS domain-containing protein [Nocardia speluncae]NKY32971.1 CBS domain-containing protein [Nocardia speluncae]